MKRVLFILLAVLFSVSAYAEVEGQKVYISNLFDFEARFCAAAQKLQSGHDTYLNDNSIQRIDGEYIDGINISFNDSEGFLLSLEHETDNITSVLAIFISDGDINHALDYFTLLCEAIYASGIVDSLDETGAILDEVGILNNIEEGAQNSIIKEGINIGYSCSSYTGIMFYIEAENAKEVFNK